jgi:2,3-dihydroxy-p-cumate/2,3-dihydroxybenzoate 3,4-dioxygenase
LKLCRDAGITGFTHIGLNSTDPARDERFWTQVCNAYVSDRIGDIPLMRVNAIHHAIDWCVRPRPASSTSTIRWKPATTSCGRIISSTNAACRSCSVPADIRRPALGFLYFKGPDGMIFEYSVGVDEIEDDATHYQLLHVGI